MEEVCHISKTLKIIGSKWTLLVIKELLTGTKRFSQLQKSLGGVSPRTLSGRLKDLENHNLIKKVIYPTIPPKSEYSLTPAGHDLSKVVFELRSWGEQHLSA